MPARTTAAALAESGQPLSPVHQLSQGSYARALYLERRLQSKAKCERAMRSLWIISLVARAIRLTVGFVIVALAILGLRTLL